MYNLSANILATLQENAFENAIFLCYITIPQLEKMGLHLGEIAALHDVVEKWSIMMYITIPIQCIFTAHIVIPTVVSLCYHSCTAQNVTLFAAKKSWNEKSNHMHHQA